MIPVIRSWCPQTIHSFQDMQAVATSAMGDESDIFPWAQRSSEQQPHSQPHNASGAEHSTWEASAGRARSLENDWHQKPDDEWDNFQLRRHLSILMLSSADPTTCHVSTAGKHEHGYGGNSGSGSSFFDHSPLHKDLGLGKIRDAEKCTRIVSGLCSTCREASKSELPGATDIAQLVVSSMNGALLRSALQNELENGEDGPKEEVQERLADMPCDAIHLVTNFISRSYPPILVSRVARLACLLLHGGNTRVQDAFQDAEAVDCAFNR